MKGDTNTGGKKLKCLVFNSLETCQFKAQPHSAIAHLGGERRFLRGRSLCQSFKSYSWQMTRPDMNRETSACTVRTPPELRGQQEAAKGCQTLHMAAGEGADSDAVRWH